MPAEVAQINKADGRAMFAGAEAAWHGLGTVLGRPMTVDEALRYANLDWNVWVESLPAHLVTRPDGKVAPVGSDDYYRATYREDGDEGAVLLGVVGNTYEPIQNRDAFAFVDNVVDMSGGSHVETAGGLYRGQEVFMTITWPSHLSLTNKDGRTDEVKRFLLVHTGHAGNASLSIRATNVRVVCKNTLDMAFGEQVQRVMRVRHTGDTIKGRVMEARDTLGFATASFTAFDAAAAVLFDTDTTAATFDKIVEGFFGPRPEPKSAEKAGVALTRYDERVEQVQAIYKAPQNEPIAGTAWGAWNALTEWSDWFRPVRANGKDEKAARAQAIMSGNGEKARDRALTAVLRASNLRPLDLVGAL